MKKKQLEGKLNFNKQTVAVLTDALQEQVLGGADIYTSACTLKKTACDLYTNCYNISRCMTVCGGPYC